MNIAPQRIEPQTYRIGRWVAFQTDRLSWRMGIPVFEDDPMGGFVEGSVTEHSTLKACTARVLARERQTARIKGPRWE